MPKRPARSLDGIEEEERESLRRAFGGRVKSGAEDECWLWSGYRMKNGYGLVGVRKGRTYLAHRLAWFFHHGADPGPQLVLHRCDVRNCCNPKHLWLGTYADNNQDRARKGRSFSTLHPEKTHFVLHPEDAAKLKGKDHGMAKLSEADVLDIRSRKPYFGMLADLGREFGVTYVTIGAILRGEIWRHLLPEGLPAAVEYPKRGQGRRIIDGSSPRRRIAPDGTHYLDRKVGP